MSYVIGNALDELGKLESGRFYTCVTSPPYWGLRDYGTATWEGGDAACSHSVGGQVQDNKAPGAITTGQRPGVDSSVCRKCGASRVDSQLGLEQTPEEYVTNMVEVFREVRRVLRNDGTLWLNLGDSYYNYRPGKGQALVKQSCASGNQDLPSTCARRGNKLDGLKEKDIVGIPWRVAFALQADGWYLRQDIIWHKPNPMPESMTDRCTKAHEYIFLMSKSAKYYFDADAIAERGVSVRDFKEDTRGDGSDSMLNGRASRQAKGPSGFGATGTRNRRSVWTVNTQPYGGSHFATFPEDLIKPCILAGAPKGGEVLDPFLGSGTTGRVAEDLGRTWFGIELNAEYEKLIKNRTAQISLGI